jgi:hypothetical protein
MGRARRAPLPWLLVALAIGTAHAHEAAPSFDRAKCAECRIELSKCFMRHKDEPPADREKNQQKCLEASKRCMSSCTGDLPKR